MLYFYKYYMNIRELILESRNTPVLVVDAQPAYDTY